MKIATLVFSGAICLAAFPAFAGATAIADNSITLAQADVTIGPYGIGVGDRARYRRDRDYDHRDRGYDRRDRDFDRDRVRRHGDCRSVTVQERGEARTTRRCD